MERQAKASIRSDDPWLLDDMVSMKHPFRLERLIFLWHCAAHLLKAVRNSLYHSRKPYGKQGARILRNKCLDVPITWAFLEDLYIWDHSKHGGRRTGLTTEQIYITGYTSMCVEDAKNIASSKVITELFHKAFKDLGISAPDHPDGKGLITGPVYRKTTILNSTNNASAIVVGHDWAKILILNAHCVDWPAHLGGPNKDPRPTIMLLVFLNEVFIQTLMKKDEYLTRDNIVVYADFIRHRMNYLSEWKRTVNERVYDMSKHPPRDKQFFAKETWINLRMCICGFFAFAKYTFDKDICSEPINMLFSTSSTIEAAFAQVLLTGVQ